MDWKPFWKIIEDAYRPDPVDHFESLKERLEGLKWFEVVEFQARFDEAIAAANVFRSGARRTSLTAVVRTMPSATSASGSSVAAGMPTNPPSRTRTRWRTSSMAIRSMASVSMPRRCAFTRPRPA